MPQGESEGRTVYVLAYAQAEPRRPNPGAGPSPGPIAATERELEIERELEMEMKMGTDDESDGPQPGPKDLAAVGPSGEAELEANCEVRGQLLPLDLGPASSSSWTRSVCRPGRARCAVLASHPLRRALSTSIPRTPAHNLRVRRARPSPAW